MAKEWQTKNSTSWIGKLLGSMWDSIIYTWDSLLCTWDGIGKNDWYTDNPKNYYTKK